MVSMRSNAGFPQFGSLSGSSYGANLDLSLKWYSSATVEAGFSEWHFDTSSTLLSFVFDFAGQVAGASAQLFSSDNGATWTTLNSLGGTTQTLTLGSGTKHCVFRAGLATLTSGTFSATTLSHLVALRGDAPIDMVAPPVPVHQVTVVGDSIAAGASAASIPLQAWVPLLRDRNPGHSITLLGGAGSSIWDLTQAGRLAASVAVAAATLIGTGSNTLVIEDMINDWGLNKWAGNTAAFIAAYNSFIDGVKALVPGLVVVCQACTAGSPTEEALVIGGKTADDFRAAIGVSRSLPSTYVNGKTQLLALPLQDDIHPGTGGHLTICEGYEFLLGYKTIVGVLSPKANYEITAASVTQVAGDVSAVADSSGSALHLAKAAPGGGTYHASGGPNDKAYVSGKGTAGTFLDSPVFAAQTAPYSVLVLLKWTGAGIRYVHDGQSVNANCLYDLNGDTGQLNSSIGYNPTTGGVPAGWTLYDLRFEPAATPKGHSYVNGAAANSGNVGVAGVTKVRWFAAGDGTAPGADSIAYWALIPGVMSAAQAHSLKIWLLSEYAFATSYS